MHKFFIPWVSSIFLIMTMSADAMSQEGSSILQCNESCPSTDCEIHELKNNSKTGGLRTAGDSSSKEKEPYIPNTQFERGEVLVLDPPDNFASDIRSLNFRVIETLSFEEYGMEIIRVRIPSHMNLPTATQKLLDHFPNLIIDPNYIYKPSRYDVPSPKKLPRSCLS